MGGAYNRGGASLVGILQPIRSRDLLQWVVGLQQHRRHKLFVLKAEVAVSASP